MGMILDGPTNGGMDRYAIATIMGMIIVCIMIWRKHITLRLKEYFGVFYLVGIGRTQMT